MAPPVMTTSPLRLLLNAEPFGFGPTAAIAGFFPHLRPHFATIGYMGKKHTLDLQTSLPYDAIHDVSGTPKDERSETYQPIFDQYDILLTAMDHKVAESAQAAGLKVFYYDALAWYWPEIPVSMQQADLYLAQDFFGVAPRLREIFGAHAGHVHVVPPIVPAVPSDVAKTHVLINLGGLQNPYWPVDDVIAYAQSVIGALKAALPADTKLVIAGSAAVADACSHLGVRTYPRSDMQDILAQSQVAFMTPGLGNIYDAAAYNLPTIWLPPANDSQGQQLDLLTAQNCHDAAIDWADIVPGATINYCADQPTVLAQIAAIATSLTHTKSLQTRLTACAQAAFQQIVPLAGSRTAQIIDRFGRGGEEAVARHVINKAKEYTNG